MYGKKVADYIYDVRTEVKNAQTTLYQAHEKAEKAENVAVIQDAIASLDFVQECLCKYKD